MSAARAAELRIVRARAEQAAALSDLAHRAKAHWGYPRAWLERWRGELTFTSDQIRRHDVHVVMLDARPLGVYALSGRGAVLELEHFWIEPAQMGRGLGRRLLEHAAALARSRGAVALEIDSDPHAEGFYLHHGARPVGRTPSPMPGAQQRDLPRLRLDLG